MTAFGEGGSWCVSRPGRPLLRSVVSITHHSSQVHLSYLLRYKFFGQHDKNNAGMINITSALFLSCRHVFLAMRFDKYGQIFCTYMYLDGYLRTCSSSRVFLGSGNDTAVMLIVVFGYLINMDRYFVHTGTWMGTYVRAARPGSSWVLVMIQQ